MNVRRRLWARTESIPSSDVAALRSAARRTRIVRGAVVIGIAAVFAAAVATASDLEPRKTSVFPRDASVVVVLDLSQSVGDRAAYRRMHDTFERLMARDASVGLIAFSDSAYELLPPGSPASGLRPVVRLLTPTRGYPRDPWGETFRSGTRISAGLELARDVIRRDQVKHGTILLISDLQTAPSDVTRLGRTLVEMRESSISVRIVPLFPSRDTRFFFERLLGEGIFVAPRDLTPAARAQAGFTGSARVPVLFVVAAGTLLMLLAGHLLWCSRIVVPRASIVEAAP